MSARHHQQSHMPNEKRTPLTALAGELAQDHREFLATLNKMRADGMLLLYLARRAGKNLARAKKYLPGPKLEKWLMDNELFSLDEAKRYLLEHHAQRRPGFCKISRYVNLLRPRKVHKRLGTARPNLAGAWQVKFMNQAKAAKATFEDAGDLASLNPEQRRQLLAMLAPFDAIKEKLACPPELQK